MATFQSSIETLSSPRLQVSCKASPFRAGFVYRVSEAEVVREVVAVLEDLREVVANTAASMPGNLTPEQAVRKDVAFCVPAPIMAEVLQVLAKVRGGP